MHTPKPKVFGIGFHKTGTKSLAIALEQLGYRVTGPDGVKDPDISQNVYRMADQLIKEYDAFQDNPWPIIYEYLDQSYPQSRFILTIRDSDAWLQSALRYFGTKKTPMREWIYGAGSPVGNEDVYLARYEQHNQEVLEYFKHRQDDLLVMDFAKGDGWEKLCRFLKVDTPSMAFPHVNRT